MKKLVLKDLHSVKEFGKNLNKTFKLLNSVRDIIVGIEAFLATSVKKGKVSDYDKKMIRRLTISKREKNQIFEMGYVTLFSHFEFFMCDLLKDLFFKFPKSLSVDISFDEIRDFRSVKRVKEYIIDSAAIRKSYSMDTWLEFIKKSYGINIISDKEDLTRLFLLSAYRNIILHSGGKTNARFRNSMRTLLKSDTDTKIGEKWDLDMQKYFYILYQLLKKILGDLKKL